MDRLPRYILADEVGLGKTIEAGIIIHDLLERKPSAKGVGRNNHTRERGSMRTSHLGKVGDRCNRSSNFALAALHKRTPLA